MVEILVGDARNPMVVGCGGAARRFDAHYGPSMTSILLCLYFLQPYILPTPSTLASPPLNLGDPQGKCVSVSTCTSLTLATPRQYSATLRRERP